MKRSFSRMAPLFIKRYSALLIACLAILTPAFSQITSIEGFIRESGTGDPISFAKIYFKGTYVGAITDTSGYFEFSIRSDKLETDSIVAKHLGYFGKTIPIFRDSSQQLNIELRGKLLQLDDVVITPGENRAWPILRRVIANKKKNNPDYRKDYYSKEYSKIRFDLNHFSEKLKKNLLVKPFDYIWDNVDTTQDGVNYLPVLLVEKVISHYYQSSPRDKRDVLEAQNTVGLPGRNLLQFVEELYWTPNIYDNFVVILDKNFPSPINDNYKRNYKFFPMDSVIREDGENLHHCLQTQNKAGTGFYRRNAN